MEGELTDGDFVYVLKQGRRLGPFSLDDLLDGVETGEFSPEDICLREGATDCERLREILDWDEEEIDEVDEDGVNTEASEDEEDLPIFPGSRPSHDPAVSSRSTPPERRPLYVGHPSIVAFPISLLAVTGGVTGGIWLIPIDPVLTFAAFGIALLGTARLSLVRFTHDYRIANRRIEVVTGLIARSSREVRIEDVRAINVTCRGLTGMFGIGTVEFFTSGDSPEVSFERVWSARRVKTLVRRLQDSA